MTMAAGFAFRLLHTHSGGAARCGLLQTFHGSVDTPAFLPVATQGTVKGLRPAEVRATGAQMLLANTYHLLLRPGEEVVAAVGGLHRFMGWEGPILTDSGGFQIYSLAQRAEVSESGVVFRSHLDGQRVELTPERAVAVQEALGSDVAMVLDQVVPLPNRPEVVAEATARTVRWAARSQAAAQRTDQVLFAIVQGGLEAELRIACARELRAMGFAGYAIGGLSVGEEPVEMYRALDVTVPELPHDRPRYLMGVGRPVDVLEAIGRGIDLMDCVMPTRNGRNATAFTDRGPLRLRNAQYQRDPRPIEEGCPCAACQHSRAYLRHLFLAEEMLGPILVSLHNLTFYQRLFAAARAAILADCFGQFRQERISRWSAASAC
jgi:queuine tRNA-ribosyltransferase